MSEVASTKELKRVLGRKELLSIGIGQTIGSGIFAMVGIGIAMTGRSASISMLIAAIFTIFTNIPLIFVAGTVRLRGGFTHSLHFWGMMSAQDFSLSFISCPGRHWLCTRLALRIICWA